MTVSLGHGNDDACSALILFGADRGRQAPEPVFSVAKPLAFQSVQAVFREGLVDPTLVNAVMLALVSAVAGSKIERERLGYQYKAIAGIRERMDRVDEATSETTIGAILLLAGIEVSFADASKGIVKLMIAGPPRKKGPGSITHGCCAATAQYLQRARHIPHCGYKAGDILVLHFCIHVYVFYG